MKHSTQFLWIPVFQFAGAIGSTLYLLLLFRRNFGPVRVSFDSRGWLGILKDSLPMGLSSALSMIMFNFDIVLLGFLKPASDIGQYSASYKVIAFFSSLIFLYNRNLLPAVSRSRDNPIRLQYIADRTQKYTLLLSVPLALGGVILARPLMQLIFGPEFSTGATALKILIWIIPISSIRVLYRVTLLSHGLQNYNLRISLAAAAVNIGLNFLLIPHFSYIGSAGASAVAEILLLFLSWNCVSGKVVRLLLLKHLWKPVVSSAAMAIFVE